jgi:hypothetical protein
MPTLNEKTKSPKIKKKRKKDNIAIKKEPFKKR